MPLSLLDLNEDVLGHVVSHLDSADARQLSRTARSIHDIADHHALQSVTLRSLVNVMRFCTYILTDKRQRLLSLRELRIHCPLMPRLAVTRTDPQMHGASHTSYGEAAGLVANLIQEAKGLQVLALHSAEHWLQHEPRLGDALSSLGRLLDIELQSLGPNTSTFIAEMNAAPRKLVFSRPFVRERRGLRPHYPLQGKLTLDTKRYMPSVQYLAVIEDTVLPNPTILARVFPALRSLDIEPGGPFHSLTAADPSYTVSWPLLERVRGPSHLLSRWQNATVVHLIHLTDLLCVHGPHNSARPRPAAGAWDTSPVRVLSSFQPVAFIAQLDSYIPTSLWHQLLGYTSSFCLLGGSARLRYVAIELSDIVTRDTAAAELNRWWVSAFAQRSMGCPLTVMYQDNAYSAVKASGIICLEIRCPMQSSPQLDCISARNTTVESNLSSGESIFHTFLERVCNAAPKLHYLSLDLSPGGVSRWRHDFLDPEYIPLYEMYPDLHWWSFKYSSGRAVRSLDPARGEQIAAYLRSTRYDYSLPFDGAYA